MKDDDRSLFESKPKNLFVVPEGTGMGSDVSDAAKILRSFVSRIGPTERNNVDLFPSDPDTVKPETKTQEATELDQYIASASQVSRDLADEAPRITPRVIAPSSDGLAAIQEQAKDVRLVYKGKASKKQLERLRKKIMQQAESRSSLQAVSGSWDSTQGK